MNSTFYEQVHDIIRKQPQVDCVSFYFLGICTKYIPNTIPLEKVLNHLPLNFFSLYEIFSLNKREIGFLARTLLRIVQYTSLEVSIKEGGQKADFCIPEVEEDIRLYFKDFDLLRLLYSQISKAQWFCLGCFMKADPFFDLFGLLKEIYIEILVQNPRLDEQGQIDFILSILNKRKRTAPEPQTSNSAQVETRNYIDNASEDNQILRRKKSENLEERNSQTTVEDKDQRTTPCGNLRYEFSRMKQVIRRINAYDDLDSERKYHDDSTTSHQIYQTIEYSTGEPLKKMDSKQNMIRSHPDQIMETNPKALPPLEEKRELKENLGKKEIILSSSAEENVVNSSESIVKPLSSRISELPVTRKQPRNCPVCFENLFLSPFILLKHCKHYFHKQCFKQYIESRIDERIFPIVCPADKCPEAVDEADITKALDPVYKDKFYSFSLKHFAETHLDEVFFCPAPNCEYFAFTGPTSRVCYCTTCEKVFCIKCKGEWHDGMTCEENKLRTIKEDENENDRKFETYVRHNQCQKCPKCLFYIIKNDGCNHMTCRCGKEFCYECGNEMNSCRCPQENQGYYDDY